MNLRTPTTDGFLTQTMKNLRTIPFIAVLLMMLSFRIQAQPSEAALSVWANEAIVATYTYNHENFLQRQKKIAKYFTSKGWIAYSKALTESKLPETVKLHSYNVSAVATMPPKITETGNKRWKASMPLLVLYENPQYQQKQTLAVTIEFSAAPPDQGVRGLAITSLDSKVSIPPCQCDQGEQPDSKTPPKKQDAEAPETESQQD